MQNLHDNIRHVKRRNKKSWRNRKREISRQQ
jgi:hypothetical protein